MRVSGLHSTLFIIFSVPIPIKLTYNYYNCDFIAFNVIQKYNVKYIATTTTI